MDASLPTRPPSRSRATGSSAGSGRTSGRCRRRTASTCAVAASCPRSPTRTSTSRPGRSRAATSRSRAPRRSTRRSPGPGAPRRAASGSAAAAGATRNGPRSRPAAALDAVVGDTPAALWSKDYHSLWLSSAALARAGGDLDVPGGVVERDRAGEPTGILREESAWRFRERHVTVSEDEWVAATREGLKLASARGVGAIHDKDGWLGAPAIFGRLHEARGLTLRVWQSLPAEQAGQLAELGLRSRLGDDYLRLGYLKAFMDGTLGSQTAWMLDGTGCLHHERRGARRADPRRGGGGLADRRPRDRRPREPRGARRLRGDARRLAAARPTAAHRARAVPRPGRRPSLRGARRRVLGAVQPRALRPRPRRAVLGRPARGDVRLPLARRQRRRRRRTARTLRSRSSTRSRESAQACCARSTSGRRGAPRSRSRSSRRSTPRRSHPPGSRATSGDAGSSCPASSPTSSSSTATRRGPAGRAARRAGRRDHGRRPLGAPASTLGLGVALSPATAVTFRVDVSTRAGIKRRGGNVH